MTPTNTPDALRLAQEQDKFEAAFPMPDDCLRIEGGYSATDYGAWQAHDYKQKWAGWKARAIEAEVLRLNGGGGEAETFEQWNAKQHGDPEEIGFLQALRIAYCSGQDSVYRAKPQQAEPGAQVEGWPCVVVEADFEENTVTVEMKTKDWRINAGEYFLSAYHATGSTKDQP